MTHAWLKSDSRWRSSPADAPTGAPGPRPRATAAHRRTSSSVRLWWLQISTRWYPRRRSISRRDPSRPQIPRPGGVVEADHPARGHRGVDARLGGPQVKWPGRSQAAQVGPEGPEGPGDRRLDTREREERPVVEVVAGGDRVVIGDHHGLIPRVPVALQERLRGQVAVGAGGVAVELGFPVDPRSRVGVDDAEPTC